MMDRDDDGEDDLVHAKKEWGQVCSYSWWRKQIRRREEKEVKGITWVCVKKRKVCETSQQLWRSQSRRHLWWKSMRENPIIHLCCLDPHWQGALEQSFGLVTMCQHQYEWGDTGKVWLWHSHGLNYTALQCSIWFCSFKRKIEEDSVPLVSWWFISVIKFVSADSEINPTSLPHVVMVISSS